MIQSFKKVLKIILNIFLCRDHKVNEIGVKNNTIQFNLYPIIDLEKKWELNSEKSELLSYEGDSTFGSSGDYPIIETWTKVKNKTYAPNNFFIKNQSNFLKKTKGNKNIFINECLYLLPYYTSHFGHFVGDVLGSILYYLSYIKDINSNNKLLITTPSIKWDNFLNKINSNKLKIIKPREFVGANYIIRSSKILPRMSSYQNMVLAKNILENEIKENTENDKIFLTTGRNDRISNIDELISELKVAGFKIIIPQNFEIYELLIYIKSASVLISEKASILNNVHLVRNKPYLILSSISENNLDKKLFNGAGIYKQFHTGLFRDILCDDDPVIQNVRPYKKRIKVDIQKLKKFI